MKKIIVLLFCVICSLSIFAQTNRAGSIIAIKDSEILIKNENLDSPFQAGERLHLLTGDRSVVLEVTFPMQTMAKCRLVSGSTAKLHVGLFVYSGAFPAANRGTSTGEYIAPVEPVSGGKIGKDRVENIPLPEGVVLKDARVTNGGIAFPMGESDDKIARIEKDFLIAETETTYAQWSAVKKWAENHGYSFCNNGENGQNNNLNALSISVSMQYPVAGVSWHDAIVWCNALTEYYNAASGKAVFDCVYYTDKAYMTPLRSSTGLNKTTDGENKGSLDCPYIKAAAEGNTGMENCSAKGFRLPTSEEWEYAARYRGSDSINTVSGYRNPYFTKGDSASGACGNYKDKRTSDAVAVFENYDDGSATGVIATANAKSKNVNTLGLYDMSGNVMEWCFDICHGTGRMLRGGSYYHNAWFTQVGHISDDHPTWAIGGNGFRFSRTK